MDSRDCRSLDEFDSKDQGEESESDGSVIIEEDDSDVEGDIFL
jgi:hypothetical protein